MKVIYWTVFVTVPGARRAQRIAPDGYLTNRRVHAAMIPMRDTAERVAAEINRDHGAEGFHARAAAF